MAIVRILTAPTTLSELADLAKETYIFMIKGAVDIVKERVAFGGDYHIESCEELTKTGSAYLDVWGCNLVFDENGSYTIEYDSLINIKPAAGNHSRIVDSIEYRDKIRDILQRYIV